MYANPSEGLQRHLFETQVPNASIQRRKRRGEKRTRCMRALDGIIPCAKFSNEGGREGGNANVKVKYKNSWVS